MSAVELTFDSRGNGAPVLFAHAIGYDRSLWDRTLPHLSPNRSALLVDLRGHGRSPAPPGPYTVGMLADDCAALLDLLGVDAVDFVGLSLGGMVGQAFALRHPQRLRRLVLANTSSGYGPEAHVIWDERKQRVREGGVRAIRDLAITRGFSEAFRREHPEAVAAAIAPVMACPVEGYAGCCDAIASLDLAAQLPRIAAPTLAIAGSLDVGTPVEMLRGIAAAIPGAQLAVIEGAAHLSAVEKPAEFAGLVDGFLDGND
jgi:3-oxoadipate enol-lactonase